MGSEALVEGVWRCHQGGGRIGSPNWIAGGVERSFPPVDSVGLKLLDGEDCISGIFGVITVESR